MEEWGGTLRLSCGECKLKGLSKNPNPVIISVNSGIRFFNGLGSGLRRGDKVYIFSGSHLGEPERENNSPTVFQNHPPAYAFHSVQTPMMMKPVPAK